MDNLKSKEFSKKDTIPGHDVVIERLNNRIQVIVEGELIADTTTAIKVYETGFDPVIYIPKNDLKAIDLIKTGEYECPVKGHAELYTLRHGETDIEHAAWSYSDPIDIYPELRGRVAFYPDKIQEINIGI